MKTLLLALVFSGVTVWSAHAAFAEGAHVYAHDVTEKTTSTAHSATEVSDVKARIDERKARLNTKLDAATQKNISGKCVSAQAKLKMVSAKLKETNEKYIPKYEEFIKKSENMESSLSGDGVKSSELLGQIGEAKTKLAAVKTATQSLQASVDDAASVDCKADPTGFKATVDDARIQSKALTEAKHELTKYARTTLKTTLQSIKVSN